MNCHNCNEKIHGKIEYDGPGPHYCHLAHVTVIVCCAQCADDMRNDPDEVSAQNAKAEAYLAEGRIRLCITD